MLPSSSLFFFFRATTAISSFCWMQRKNKNKNGHEAYEQHASRLVDDRISVCMYACMRVCVYVKWWVVAKSSSWFASWQQQQPQQMFGHQWCKCTIATRVAKRCWRTSRTIPRKQHMAWFATTTTTIAQMWTEKDNNQRKKKKKKPNRPVAATDWLYTAAGSAAETAARAENGSRKSIGKDSFSGEIVKSTL